MTWPQYYSSRVNNPESLARYRAKYLPFFEMIAREKAATMAEFGCGIASCTKILLPMTQGRHFLVDNDWEMLRLAMDNLGIESPGRARERGIAGLYLHDIKKSWPGHWFIQMFGLIHSHGVLEHFSNDEIRRIVWHQRTRSPVVMACVPTDKYEKASFGDERLMPPEEWQRIIPATDMQLMNDGHDLVMTWRTP